MKLKACRAMIKRLHETERMELGQYGALLYANSGIPVWTQIYRNVNQNHRNYSTIGFALQYSRGVRGEHSRRAKWFRRLLLRDLGLPEIDIPATERNK